MSELRAVPIFCTVCLVKYEISDRVCWSSNSKCSHMFHEDCILQWLATLGRTHSRAKLFSASATPSEKKLLDFDLTCPCCTQDFISRKVILGGVFMCFFNFGISISMRAPKLHAFCVVKLQKIDPCVLSGRASFGYSTSFLKRRLG